MKRLICFLLLLITFNSYADTEFILANYTDTTLSFARQRELLLRCKGIDQNPVKCEKWVLLERVTSQNNGEIFIHNQSRYFDKKELSSMLESIIKRDSSANYWRTLAPVSIGWYAFTHLAGAPGAFYATAPIAVAIDLLISPVTLGIYLTQNIRQAVVLGKIRRHFKKLAKGDFTRKSLELKNSEYFELWWDTNANLDDQFNHHPLPVTEPVRLESAIDASL